MKFLLQRVHRSAVAWSFFATVLRVGANVFVLPFVLRKLPSDQLGIWYVFGAIGGLASLLDFGFEQTITRMTSFAWGGATRFVAFGIHQEDAAPENPKPNLPLLRDLIATLKAYYFYVGIAVLVLLGVGGSGWIWFKTEGLDTAETLRLAWLVYAAGCCLNFVIGRWPALLTGVGAVREAQQAAILSQLFYYVIVIAGLLAGLGIWALVLGLVGMGFVARHWGKKFFKKKVHLPGGLPGMRFHREMFHAVWPNAWRTGMVGIGAFLSLQANTLICSAMLSLKITAAYGLGFQLVNILFGLCGVWVAVKLPLINTLRVQGRNEEIASLFARRMRLTLLSYAAGALAIIYVAPLALHWLGSKTPLISTEQLAVLALIRFLELHQTQYCLLVLSENHNPFLKPSLISGVAIVVVSLVLTPLYGIWGLLFSMGVVQLFFNVWWPVLRALRGLEQKPADYFLHQFLRPKAWLELF
jgi:O-antigen/teichoic acid export membrane protein